MWIFSRVNTVVADAYEKAAEITRLWPVSSRTKERYTAVIAGNYMFEVFCAEQGIDATARITRAIESLQRCAVNQTQSSVSLAEAFRVRLRQMLTDKKVCFMGPPTVGPDGTIDNPYSQPYTIKIEKTPDEQEIVKRILPPNVTSLEELGAINYQNNVIPAPNAQVRGYVIPPRGETGKAGSPLKTEWVIVLPTLRFTNLCEDLTAYSRLRDGQIFRPNDVIESLMQEETYRGGKARIRVATSPDPAIKINATSNVEIDCKWLFSSIEESE